jgi:hypothetical protein
MKPNTSPIERAFELARSGKCRTLGDIKIAMRDEGFSIETITGGVLRKQLRDAMLMTATASR